ncbi:NAD(P)H-hydrate dehydratase [Aliiglaciecola litoralis]|uniref:Bifunctional NAD(P)H-hydrate repair enzyme n=1 Tax=Aliiglaciecola litoralis TaxID=582857 RepID=A0ABN1LT70_9ALTE
MSQRSLSAQLSAQRLPQNLYSSQSVKDGEVLCAKQHAISMYQLMEEAGNAASKWLCQQITPHSKVVVVVGTGNNGGDGYVAAKQLLKQGYAVKLCSVAPTKTLMGEAQTARLAWLEAGEKIADALQQDFTEFDVILDALLGTGLQGKVRDDYQDVIEAINASGVEVFSIDVPSGIDADTGASLGASVVAKSTITFIGIKSGLVTGNGKQHTGTLSVSPLSIGDTFCSTVTASGRLISYACFAPLPQRALNSHKGDHGKLVCIGGNKGTAGAIRLSAEAALRCGAGLVKVYCHANSVSSVLQGRPEIMASDQHLSQMLDWADCIVMGPGLGQDAWSRECFNQVLSYLVHHDKSVVLDADGLNLLTQHKEKLQLTNFIITPHAGEAARLIDSTAVQVEADRYKSATLLQQQYAATCILKGPGSVIRHGRGTFVCSDGNPGMSTAGMGDLLSGVLGAMMAQGMHSEDAGVYGTCLHSAAADRAAEDLGQRGMIAGDLLPYLRKLVN